MDTFNLWNPYAIAPRVLEFDVTPTEIGTLKNGTIDWISHCLRTWEINLLPTQWSVIPFRSHFYSDYPNEIQWEYRWPTGWLIRVEFSEDIPILEDISILSAFSSRSPVGVDVIDLSVEGDCYDSCYDTRHDHTVLVVSEFTGASGNYERIQQEFVRLARGGLSEAVELQCSIRILPNQNWQIRTLIEHIELPNCVSILDGLRDYLSQQGGAITWREVFTLKPAALDWKSISYDALDWSQGVPSEDELRVIFKSEQPGLFGPYTGANQLAQSFGDIEPANRAKLAKLIATLVMDKNVRVRSGAIQFFQQRPEVPDGNILSEAFELRSSLFIGIEAKPQELSGDLQFQLARALAERSKVGDVLARETLRREALRPGCGKPTIIALFLSDRDWLFEKAADIVISTPELAVLLIREMVSQQQDLRPFLLSVSGHVPRELLETALADAEPENLEDYLILLTDPTD
jgi:hypothetical protein